VGAEEAGRIGLVSRVVAGEDLEPQTAAIARQIVGNTPLGVALTKQALQQNVDAPSLEAAVAFENRGQALASRTPEFRERVERFLAQRAGKN
jgi:enoyl-CoA hydratase